MKEIVSMLTLLLKLIKEVKELITSGLKSQNHLFSQLWLDNQDVSMALHLSKRTLQTLRDNGTLPYSRIKDKIFYKSSDVLALLESNYYRNLTAQRKGGDL
ncbi:MAG TPA: helix-turn-helix domain-containing protein [Prolixibacteraceae bacterium]|nr:helix-turn-helix domain-containing protein [Prolixibacteraceae bacterium]